MLTTKQLWEGILMKRYLIKVSLLCIFFLVSCASNDIEKNAPEFDVTNEQINALSNKFKSTDYDVLTLLMIDRKGKVVNSKLITWNKRRIEETVARRFSLQMTQALEFSADLKRKSDYLLLPYGFNISTTYDL